ncbi:conserved hypothetical protein [Alteracholeplasma palmae J233]|uniref:Uncharacterized protein n=1 Tax=Alteracholeplasma palmae (strain ATCC 49389 / J233) TaxID=1318466 RepID=U4KL75_ALTPJ|nr:hypothetical protein [Alteracholeplasma palmae]CCV64644.1 conserved hypothetical protein [Alteracholeplasma palmae J233]
MAKKYKNIESKISPVTIISIILVLVGLITLMVVLQPSAKTTLTKDYLNAGVNSSIADDYKFTEENHITPLNNLNDKWFGIENGLYSEIKKDQVTIVFFGNKNDANSVGSLAYVEYYLYKHAENKELSEKVKQIYHFNTEAVVENVVNKKDIKSVFEKISEKFEIEDELTSITIPTLVAFKNGQVLKQLPASTAALSAVDIKNFYVSVLELSKK